MTSVLLVDDHEMLREGLGAIIESHEELDVVGHASDGRDAVEVARDLQPDVIVMDVWLPSLSGIDATSEIVRERPNAKVIILSVHEKQSIVEQSIRAGAMGYVVKSACSRELFEAIEAVSQGKSYLSPSVTQSMLESIKLGGRPKESGGFASLTSREREVLQHIAEGRSTKEIAATLHISPRTAESHRASLMRKLEVHKVSSLVRIAIREELVAP